MFAHVDSVVHGNSAYVQSSSIPSKASSVASEAPAVPAKASTPSVATNPSVTVAIRHTGELVSVVEPVAIGVGEVSVGIPMRETMSLRNTHDAQTSELIRSSDRAHLRDLPQSPATSCVAATLHLGVLATQLRGAAAISQSRETGAHTLIHTSGAICTGDVASRTGADVATGGVGALSSITHAGNGAALINIFTLVVSFTLTVAGGAFAFVGSHSVDTVAS